MSNEGGDGFKSVPPPDGREEASPPRKMGKETSLIRAKEIDAEVKREEIEAALESKRIDAALESERIRLASKKLDKDGEDDTRNDKTRFWSTIIGRVVVGISILGSLALLGLAIYYGRGLAFSGFGINATTGSPATMAPATMAPAQQDTDK